MLRRLNKERMCCAVCLGDKCSFSYENCPELTSKKTISKVFRFSLFLFDFCQNIDTLRVLEC